MSNPPRQLMRVPLLLRRITRMPSQIGGWCLVAVGVAACSPATAPSPGLAVDLALSTTIVRPSDSAAVTLTIRNISRDTVQIEEGCRPAIVSLARVDGAPIARPDVVCTLLLTVTQLPPGASRVTRMPWRRITDEERAPTFTLPTGRYRVGAVVQYNAVRTARSAPVEVEVVP